MKDEDQINSYLLNNLPYTIIQNYSDLFIYLSVTIFVEDYRPEFMIMLIILNVKKT